MTELQEQHNFESNLVWDWGWSMSVLESMGMRGLILTLQVPWL